MSERIAPGVPGPPRDRLLPAERRAARAVPGDLGGAAVEREVDALALDPERLVDPAIEQDVAAGEQGPGRAGIEGVTRGRSREACASAASRPRSRTRSTPNSDWSAQARARTAGVTSSARRNAEPLAVLGEVLGQRARVVGAGRAAPASAGRSTPTAGEDRIRLRRRRARARRSACSSRRGPRPRRAGRRTWRWSGTG